MKNKNIYQLFRVGILVKGGISLLEVVAGIVVLFLPIDFMLSVSQELTEKLDPDTFLVSRTIGAIHHLAALSGLFVAIYLLSRGGIKLLLIIALLKNQLWAYPWSLIVLGLFDVYQIYEIINVRSIGIIVITLFDFVVMYFIWREWRVVKSLQGERATTVE